MKEIQGLEQAGVFPGVPCHLLFGAVVPLAPSILMSTCEEHWFHSEKKKSMQTINPVCKWYIRSFFLSEY